jgi:hypothetical protein
MAVSHQQGNLWLLYSKDFGGLNLGQTASDDNRHLVRLMYGCVVVSGLAEERPETFLLKMPVVGQYIGDLFFAHRLH